MKRLIGMLAAVAFVGFGLASAQALPVPGVPPAIIAGGTVTMGGNTFVGIIPHFAQGSGLLDHYFIDTTADGNLSVSLIDNPIPASGISTIFGAVKLFDITAGAFVNTVLPVPPYPDTLSSFSLIFSGLLSAHKYDLFVNYGTGVSGGIYGGTLLLTAVPLPASFMLLLTATGLLGFFVYRQRRTSTI